MNSLSDYERGWLEALIDGEGCLTYLRGKNRFPMPVLKITNTNKELLEKARSIIGRGTVRAYYPSQLKSGRHRRLPYSYVLYATGLREILPQLSLIEKRGRQREMLEYLSVHKLGYQSGGNHR